MPATPKAGNSWDVCNSRDIINSSAVTINSNAGHIMNESNSRKASMDAGITNSPWMLSKTKIPGKGRPYTQDC